MSKPKFSAWSYVLLVQDTVVGAFPSAALAYGHWLAYAEKYSNPDDPLVTVHRFRYCLDPYTPQQEDLTIVFVNQWQRIREMKQKKEIEQ